MSLETDLSYAVRGFRSRVSLGHGHCHFVCTVHLPFGVYANINRSLGLWWLRGMPRMDVTLSEEKIWLIRFTFHSPLSESIRLLTLVSAGRIGGRDSTLKVEGRGSQRFVQMPMSLPAPTYQR